MSKQTTNSNGVTCIIDSDGIHCSYYVGDDITFRKTFKNLTDKEISRLSVDDML
jgi:hypothetical protein